MLYIVQNLSSRYDQNTETIGTKPRQCIDVGIFWISSLIKTSDNLFKKVNK